MSTPAARGIRRRAIGRCRRVAVASLAVDAAGHAYVAGFAASSEATFPVTVGPDLTYNGPARGYDAVVAKVRPDGSGLVYAGYIGGDSQDAAHAIAIDAAGSAYLVGGTVSTEATFPVTVGPDLTHNGFLGLGDMFVAKVGPGGATLVYAGYIGGEGNEE